MKKLFFTLVLALGLSTVANAQEVGKIWVGGSLGFSSTKIADGDRATAYKILPEVGYIMSENLGVAVRLGYAHNDAASSTFLGAVGGKDAFTVNPFLRYSFCKGDIGGLFIDGGVGYTYAKNGDVKTNAFEVGFRPGVAVKVSEKIALTGKFGFLGYQNAKVGDVKNDKFGLDLDMGQTELGVSIVF